MFLDNVAFEEGRIAQRPAANGDDLSNRAGQAWIMGRARARCER